MAQIAMILRAPTQNHPAEPAAGGGESLFAPHLDRAMADTPSPGKKTSPPNHQDVNFMAVAAEPGSGMRRHADGAIPAPRNDTGRGDGNNGPAIFLRQLQNHAFQKMPTDGFAGVQKQRLTLSSPSAARFMPGNEPPLQRLRQIINNSSEQGIVSVNRSTAALSIETAVAGIGHLHGEGLKLAPEHTGNQLRSLRQSAQQQYYLAKVDPTAADKERAAATNTSRQTSSDGSHSNDRAAQPSLLVQQHGTASQTAEPAAGVAVLGHLQQDGPAPFSGQTLSPPMLPPGALQMEENVVHQFMARFQLGRKLSSSTLNIKLHPAELGELKIDLAVKEGAVRVSVVAQSQQVQEIIERNIARLRSLLEGQGFSLDSVTVTTESDSVSDFDLFDRQLFSQHDDLPGAPGIVTEGVVPVETDNFSGDEYFKPPGVNVRI